MKAFLATVLSVIAAGVLMIAYGLIAPRAGAATPVALGAPSAPVMYDAQTGTYQLARPMYASERVPLSNVSDEAYGAPAYRVDRIAAPRGVAYPVSKPARQAPARLVAPRGRDWTKTALVIGGSTAGSAGLGGLIGGKKGALIGAALGGGASTLSKRSTSNRLRVQCMASCATPCLGSSSWRSSSRRRRCCCRRMLFRNT